MERSGAEWSGVERSGAEWSGVERSGAEWSGVERSGAEWSGVEQSGAEWSRVERSGAEWSGVERSGAGRRRINLLGGDLKHGQVVFFKYIKGQSLESNIAAALGLELHHPIISKLWGLGNHTYRHTYFSGPALSTRGNLVPWSAPVARVHPRTVKHCYLPYLWCYKTPNMMVVE